MNKILSKTGLFAALALAAAVSFTACEDEPDRYRMTDGVPTVYYIRPVDAAAKDSLLTGAYMGNGICIVGDNLRSVYRLVFNDREASLNTSYMTDHTILVDVPNSIPDEVTGKMLLITRQADTVSVDFDVLVPGPTLTSMSCEYAHAGDRVTLIGDYLVDDPNVPFTVTFANGVTVPRFVSLEKTSVSFDIPEGAGKGPVTVKTVYGETTSPFHYLDDRGILFDFDTDPRLTNHGWHAQKIESEDGISGNYLRLGDPSVTMDAAGNWNDNNFSFEYWPGDWTDPVSYNDSPLLTDLADFSDWENMSLKFELCIPSENAWSAAAMQIIFAGVGRVSGSGAGTDIYGNTVAGANNTFFRLSGDGGYDLCRDLYNPWAATGSFDTGGEWITVTRPLSVFTYNFDGTEGKTRLSASEFASLTLFVVGGGVEGTDCQPVLKIDNIRAVPNK